MCAAPARLFIASTRSDYECLVRTCVRVISVFSGVAGIEPASSLTEEDVQYCGLVLRRLRHWAPGNYCYERPVPFSKGHAQVRFVLEICAFMNAVLVADYHKADRERLTASGYFIGPGSVKPLEADHTIFRYALEAVEETVRRVREWERMAGSAHVAVSEAAN